LNTAAGDLVFDPIAPEPLIVLTAVAMAVLAIWVARRVGPDIGRVRNLFLLLLRLGGIALVNACLLQPSRREIIPPPTTPRVTLVGLDASLSMKQRDAQNGTRFETATRLLIDAGVASPSGMADNPVRKIYEFSDDAQPVSQSLLNLFPYGKTTRLHRSVTTMLNAIPPGEEANGIVLLTDGHDFEMVNPAKTGAAARARSIPVFAIALGRQGKVRDVATRITGFQPYCYVKQKSRVSASLRLIGCEFEDITVQLLRQGQPVQTKKVNAGELQEVPVEFETVETETGQFEYEVRALPLQGETDTANNSAITYLNVIDQQIRVLLVEGDPYWDTTFLQRSLKRNDKFEIDTLVRYGDKLLRGIRKTPSETELRAPEFLDDLAGYDVVILGRSVDRVLDAKQAALLDAFVRDRTGTVIFSRGPAFDDPALGGGLSPVLWGAQKTGRVKIDATAEGRGLSAFRALSDNASGLDSLPELLNGREAKETQPLTATLATATQAEGNAPVPAVVHRRYGRGQVVSVGVEGLWRWGLNSKIDGVNSPFDRFWDQMILWLLAGRDFIPSKQFSFRPSSANIMLGEKVRFRLSMRQFDPKVRSVPLALYCGEAEAGRVTMSAPQGDPGRLGAEFLPAKTGRYRAIAQFPDGSSQESRFIVFNENLEETEVATDALYLRRLCESSGGRVIQPAELPKLMMELGVAVSDAAPKTRLNPVWNQAWVFYLAGLLFGLDWFLRRRWGLC
jgi:hypothetical protein